MKPLEQIESLEKVEDIDIFAKKLESTGNFPLRATGVDIMQINVGKLCNMSCKHCHVEAGPHRTEIMPKDVLEKCLDIIKRRPEISTIDITGGAPEMNPHLRWFIQETALLKRRLIVRTNLTILLEDEYKDFIDIYAENKVELVASMPDYKKEKTDRQRGINSFEKCINVIRKLNKKWYGKDGTGLILDFVHNPVGAFLAGPQAALEYDYKKRLKEDYSVVFNNLFCLNNCPVGRYLDFLIRTDNLGDYMAELANAFNPAATQNVMCKSTLSIGWDGKLYDCDFNQMLELTVNHGTPSHIDEFDEDKLCIREIVINNHCYSCTAGAGSSCQGSLD